MTDEPIPNGATTGSDVVMAGAEVATEEKTPNQPERAFSWLDPHPIFVIVLVGPDEQPFGIQKDFLCARSSHYKEIFSKESETNSIEHIVKLPDTPVEVFAFAQNYMFTGQVFPSLENMPSYEVLIGVWKLGHELGIDGLCAATLDAMAECRRVTQHIPATPLLVQVWEDTPEGSSIRKLLLSWAAEYMRSSNSRAEFARSLPQGVLSELVVAMSSLEASAGIQAGTPAAIAASVLGAVAAPPSGQQSTQKRQGQNVQYVDGDESDDAVVQVAKKPRPSDTVAKDSPPAPSTTKTGARKPLPRTSLLATKPGFRRRAVMMGDNQFTAEQKLNFCADLLARMLSGPGFWTRLVGPFKEPVDPVTDGVPDYFDKIKKPMDLTTMKAKMDRKEYADEQAFLADMNQIFENCYAYWSKKDPMWAACEKLQKTFEEKYAQMYKWITKMSGDEGN